MADAQINQMRKDVIKISSKYSIIFVILTISFIFEIDDKLANRNFNYNNFSVDYDITKYISAISNTISTLILTLLYDLRLQYFIDSKSYKLLDQVHCVIEDALVASARKVGIDRFEIMRGKTEKILQLFYHFANNQKILRSMSFNYWTAYYANIKSMCIGFFSLMVMFIYLIYSNNHSRLLICPIIVITIIIALHLHTGGPLAQKIRKIPKDQIEEVLASEPDKLKTQILSRFFA